MVISENIYGTFHFNGNFHLHSFPSTRQQKHSKHSFEMHLEITTKSYKRISSFLFNSRPNITKRRDLKSFHLLRGTMKSYKTYLTPINFKVNYTISRSYKNSSALFIFLHKKPSTSTPTIFQSSFVLLISFGSL